MAIGRISTYAIFQNTLRDLSLRQLELATLQNQISSGHKSNDFAGIAGQTEQFLDLESKISKSDIYLQNNKLAQSRLEITSKVLDQVLQTATTLKNLILTRRSGTDGGSATFSQQIEDQWKALVAQLNSQSEGRFLFSGATTDKQPVDATTFPMLQNVDVPDDGYYNGSKDDLTLQIQDNIQITYNVRADAEGIQKLFAGLSEAARGDANNSDNALASAYNYVEQGVKEVITLQAAVNANKVALDDINNEHQSFKLYWQGIKEDIGNTDLVSASTQVALNEGILQASFQAFARINSLKLADFLR